MLQDAETFVSCPALRHVSGDDEVFAGPRARSPIALNWWIFIVLYRVPEWLRINVMLCDTGSNFRQLNPEQLSHTSASKSHEKIFLLFILQPGP